MPICKPLPPMTEPCSNRGYCDYLTGKCVCKSGFSSLVDFNFEEGVDCDQVALLLQVFGLLCAISAGVATIFHTRMLFLKFFRGRVLLDVVTLCMLIFVFYTLSTAVFGVVKFIYPFRIIGRDLAPTISACSCAFFFTSGCGCLVAMIGLVFRGQARARSVDITHIHRIDQLFGLLQKLFYITVPITMAGSFWPLIILVFPQFDHSMFIFATFIWIVLAIYLVVFLVGLQRMQAMLSSHGGVDNFPNPDELEEASTHQTTSRKLYDRLAVAYNLTLRLCSFVMIILLCFQFWPMMNRMISYGLIVTYTMGACCSIFWVRMFAFSGPVFTGCGDDDTIKDNKDGQHNVTSQGTLSGDDTISGNSVVAIQVRDDIDLPFPDIHLLELREFISESQPRDFSREFMHVDGLLVPCGGRRNEVPIGGPFPRLVQPGHSRVSWGTVTIKTYAVDEPVLCTAISNASDLSDLTNNTKCNLESDELEVRVAPATGGEEGEEGRQNRVGSAYDHDYDLKGILVNHGGCLGKMVPQESSDQSDYFPLTASGRPFAYFRVNQGHAEDDAKCSSRMRERPGALLDNVFNASIFRTEASTAAPHENSSSRCGSVHVAPSGAATRTARPIRRLPAAQQSQYCLQPQTKNSHSHLDNDGEIAGNPTIPNASLTQVAIDDPRTQQPASEVSHFCSSAVDMALEEYSVFADVRGSKPFFLVNELCDRHEPGKAQEGRMNNRFLSGIDI